MNPAEMLYALGLYELTLSYFTITNDPIAYKGSEIKVVCHKYLYDFLVMLDQSVAHHPYPTHTEVSKDRLNDEGIPIFEYVLDADFDVLRSKAFYGLSDELDVDICELVTTFMDRHQKFNNYALRSGKYL